MALRLVSNTETETSLSSHVGDPGRSLLVYGRTGSFSMLDVSDPNNVVVLDTVTGLVSAYPMAIDETRQLVFVRDADGFRVYDYSTPTNVVQVGQHLGFGGVPIALDLDRQLAFFRRVLSGDDSLLVIDVSNPSSMPVLGSLTVQLESGESMAYDSAKQIIYGESFQYDHVVAIDVSNSASPSVLGTLPIPGNPRDVALSDDGGHLYVCCSSEDAFLFVADVSDPTNMSIVGTEVSDRDGLRIIHDPLSKSAFVSGWDASGDRIIQVDVGSPSAPVVKEVFDDVIADGAGHLSMSGQVLYVGADYFGSGSYLLIFETTDFKFEGFGTGPTTRRMAFRRA